MILVVGRQARHLRHSLLRRRLLLRQLRHRAGSLRTTREFHRILKSSTAPAPFGLATPRTERSCATAAAQRVAQDLRFFIATTSSMCSAPTPNGGGGTMVGQQQVLSIHAAADQLPRLRRHRHLCRSRRVTRAYHPVLRLPIAQALSGLALLAERSCATVSQLPAAPAL